jgi:SAM-dependent methyltransferase
MDMWKFYDITHRHHDICNPTSEEKLRQFVDLLRLDRGSRVVDIACGKGEFLLRAAEQYDVQGIGIDMSPYFLREAKRRQGERSGTAAITFLEMDGATFDPKTPNAFRLASCLGASFIFGGYERTLRALASMVEAGGWVVSGEPYWREEPEQDYLHVIECHKEMFGTHFENIRTGENLGLDLVYTLVSSQDDFDRYEGLQWYATDTHKRANPDDPDLPELVAEVTRHRDAYFRWGRDVLGWAIYVFRRSDRTA